MQIDGQANAFDVSGNAVQGIHNESGQFSLPSGFPENLDLNLFSRWPALGRTWYTIATQDINGRQLDVEFSLDHAEYQAFTGTLVETSAVPIPASLWLFGSGLLGLVGLARRKA